MLHVMIFSMLTVLYFYISTCWYVCVCVCVYVCSAQYGCFLCFLKFRASPICCSGIFWMILWWFQLPYYYWYHVCFIIIIIIITTIISISNAKTQNAVGNEASQHLLVFDFPLLPVPLFMLSLLLLLAYVFCYVRIKQAYTGITSYDKEDVL